jgi:hypothetical protein
MEPISLFLLLQKPATFPYSDPDYYSTDPFPSYFFKKHFNVKGKVCQTQLFISNL